MPHLRCHLGGVWRSPLTGLRGGWGRARGVPKHTVCAAVRAVGFLNKKLLTDPERQTHVSAFLAQNLLVSQCCCWLFHPLPSRSPDPLPGDHRFPSARPRPGSAACQTRTRPSWTSWSTTARRPWRTGRSSSTRSTTCRRRSARRRSCATRWEPAGSGTPLTPGVNPLCVQHPTSAPLSWFASAPVSPS